MSTYTYSFPTLIHFGPGVSKQVHTAFKERGLKRPLIVTDKGVFTQGFFKEFVSYISSNQLQAAVFSDIFGNPSKSQVNAGVEAFKKHDADSIIGIGGGAALDVAKAIALMAAHPGDLFDYEDGKPDGRPVEDKIPFWVALPTTSGTGSEVGRSSVVSDDVTHVKKIIFSPKLLAKIVYADPALTLQLPAKVTAATGIDALTHCVEAYLAKGYHPICDGIALEGLRLAAKSLVAAISDPSDMQARSDMMMASMMGAIAFQKGLGLTHSCAHALSTVADLHHGLANGIMINYALKHNLEAVPERFATMARTIGLKEETGPAFIKWLEKLKMLTGTPRTLGEAGVEKSQVEKLANLAFQDGCHPSGPAACTLEDFRRIFSEAIPVI